MSPNALRYEDIQYHSQHMSLQSKQTRSMNPHFGNGRFLHWFPDGHIHANRSLDPQKRSFVNAGNLRIE
jgi:hypothetical protein